MGDFIGAFLQAPLVPSQTRCFTGAIRCFRRGQAPCLHVTVYRLVEWRRCRREVSTSEWICWVCCQSCGHVTRHLLCCQQTTMIHVARSTVTHTDIQTYSGWLNKQNRSERDRESLLERSATHDLLCYVTWYYSQSLRQTHCTVHWQGTVSHQRQRPCYCDLHNHSRMSTRCVRCN